jgi:5-hydroxyisourate hydrolase-like protein (transthyretin family)
MNKASTIGHTISTLMTIVLFFCFINISFGQDKKNMNLAVQYVKIMKEQSQLKILAQFKGVNGFEPCKYIYFNIYKTDTIDDSKSVKIGKILTNSVGKATFAIPKKFVESSGVYSVKVENNKFFEDKEETSIIKDANIEVSIEKGDSVYNIKARLTDANNQPIVGESLEVGLKRLFGNMPIGEKESYDTDEDGTITVPIDAGLTGVDHKLNFQIVLKESDVYGTVIYNQLAKSGVAIVDKSTFNQSTMWSPPTKTPLFLWIIPNTILISIWSILVFLVFNLFKIYKSKN